MTDQPMTQLTEVIAQALQRGVAGGMRPPLILCAVSPNGSVLAIRIAPPDDPDILVEKYENDTFKLPMTVVVLDQNNETMKITVSASGTTWH